MIQIIRGVYGLYTDGKVKAKGPGSEPFSLDPSREAELVEQGVAQYVGEPIPLVGFDEIPPELPEDVTGIPEYSLENTAKELREIGKMCGLDFKATMSKKEMIAALDEHIDAHWVASVSMDDLDEAEDGEDTPIFDASDAVV